MKKIISFSVWGKNPKYTLPAFINIELARKHYPDWTCRFYVDETVPEDTRMHLAEEAEVILMPKSDGYYGMFWRFLPLDDLSIDRFIVRDTDSRLNNREADAVREWEESGKIFHLMRDNIHHDPVPICGGMWGATNKFRIDYKGSLRLWLSSNSHRFFNHPRGKYFYMDQIFLADKIWPLVINKHLAHVSYNSKWPGDKRFFSTENPDRSFVGQPFEA
jgi:protein O-GlcNAc transferase